MSLKRGVMNRAGFNVKQFYVTQSKFSFSTKTQSHTIGQPGDAYISSQNSNIAPDSDLKYTGGAPLEKTIEYFCSDFGCNITEAKEIILRYPKYMNVTREEIDMRIKIYTEIGIAKEELTRDEINEIFRANPFYLLCPLKNYRLHMSAFYNFRFTKEETIRMLKEAGGVLGMKKTSIKGLFDVGKFCYVKCVFIVKRLLNIKASDFKELICMYPEFIYQHRKHILVEKIKIIQKNSNLSMYYVRDLFLRHPELFLKSHASFVAKERFLLIIMGKNLKAEKTWPIVLKFNLNQHIKPR
jgi:hypothetical protein